MWARARWISLTRLRSTDTRRSAPGCFAPFAYGAPPDSRFGAVTQLNTGPTAITTAFSSRPRKGSVTACSFRSTTRGATAWIRFRTEAFCSSPRPGFCRRFPAIWRATAGRATTIFAHNLTAQLCLPAAVESAEPGSGACGQRLAGFRHGVLSQRRALLRAERALFGERQRDRATAAARNLPAWFREFRFTRTVRFPV